jgi:hypothetical protein
VVRRLKLARLAKRETARARDVLVVAAVREAHPGAEVRLEVVSLLTGKRSTVAVDAKRAERARDEADRAIERAGRGHFEPRPDERSCPRCPYLLVCPG